MKINIAKICFFWFGFFFWCFLVSGGVLAIVDDCTISENYYCSGSKRCNYCTGKCTTCSTSCSSGKCTSKDGSCGGSDGGHFSSRPTSGLCSVGSASWSDKTASDGAYNWSCSGLYGGDSDSCSAKRNCSSFSGATVCGWNVSTCQIVEEGDVLPGYCSSGVCCRRPTCSSLYGSGFVCKDDSYCSGDPNKNASGDCEGSGQTCCAKSNVLVDICVTNAKCESLYGSSCYVCNTSVDPNNCVYKKGDSGSCGGADGDSMCSRPTSGFCNSGSMDWTDSDASSGLWKWTCSGSCGGGSDSCSVDKLSPVVSACGVAKDKIYPNLESKIPLIDDLCAEGNGDIEWLDNKGLDGTFNWTCTGACSAAVSCSVANDVPPAIIIPGNNPHTSDGTSVSVDASGRSQICQSEFGGTKIVGWRVTATDVNGVDDIGTMQLRLRSDAGVTVTSDPVVSTNGVADISIDTSGVQTGTYHVEVLVNDKDSGAGTVGWVDTGRTFRIWDCLVSVSGKFYDGSGQTISCSSGSGYTNLIPSEAVFSMAYYLGSGAPRNMNITSPNFASGDKLYWNTPVAYQPVFTGFPGADPREMRINGSTCVSGISLDPKLYVDPYVDNPSMTLEYSSVLDQDAWFRVFNGSVFAAGKVNNYVPVTCNTDNCKTSVNGAVWSNGKSTLSSYDKGQQSLFSEKSLELKDITYDYFLKNYFYKLGIGVTVSGSKKWSEISSLKGVILINGDLDIDQDIAGTDFRMITVNGNVSVGSTDVSVINAVVLSKSFTASGDSSKQLVINGSIYTSGQVSLTRSFIKKSDNNSTPAVEIKYDPSVIFKMPKEVAKTITRWSID